MRTVLLLTCWAVCCSLAAPDHDGERTDSDLAVLLTSRSASSVLVFGFMMVVTAALFSILPLTYFFGFYFGRYFIAPLIYSLSSEEIVKIQL